MTITENQRSEFLASGDAARVLSERTARVDALVLAAYERLLAPAYPHGLSLLAVGGYGRRELFPQSDIDLLVLVDQTPFETSRREALSEFLKTLWDDGLRLSHSVRTLPECLEVNEQNIELSISLLHQRFLCGDSAYYGRLEQRLPQFLRSRGPSLVRHLCRLARGRHARFHDTIYHLEPDIKESPGGLRDLHLIEWLGLLRAAPFAEVQAALEPSRDFLFRLRCYLHYDSGRDNNHLSFDAQEEVIREPFAAADEPAAWMREYFRHARAIYRAALRTVEISEGPDTSLASQFRDWRTRLSTTEFTVSRERVLLRMPHGLQSDPGMTLRLFQFVARHGTKLALETERRVADALPALHWGAVWNELLELASLPNAALALRSMHETGVLKRLLPEWERIECLVVRDFYHRYTVDEHTLVAIESLRDLAESTEPAQRRFADLLLEIADPGLLRLALVLHDVGKGSGESHTKESARIAREALDRIGAPRTQRDVVAGLIERHLDMSLWMNSRDLSDPAVVRQAADRVGTVETLKLLTLLTYADISAVHPGAMSPWRMEQLWRTYRFIHHELKRELDSERIHDLPVASPELAAFVDGFPTRYLRMHSEAEMAAHLDLERRSRATGVALELTRSPSAWSVTVVASDRAFLFASIAGALSSFGMNILQAEAFANRHGVIFDTFTFSDPLRTLELNPQEADRLRMTIERVVTGKSDVRQLLKSRPKPAHASRKNRVTPLVSFDSESSQTATLVEVVAEDRPGLLFDIAWAISSAGCNIEVVLIDTEAHKALDVFYLTSGGGKLSGDVERGLRGQLEALCKA